MLQAEQAGTRDGVIALEELCRTYWYPIYCFARRRGAAREDAEDLTQGFFADLLGRGAIARADATRGRFRTFLLSSFCHYWSHERARAGAIKRGGGRIIVSLQALQAADELILAEPANEETAVILFDRTWALRLIGRATAAVEVEYATIGKSALVRALSPMIRGEEIGESYALRAAQLGMSAGALKVAAFRLRRRLGQAIRAEIARTVGRPEDIEEELRHLLAAVQA